MSTKQIVDILDAYNHFTNADKQTLVTLFNQGNLTQANLSSSGGGGRTVYTGNVQIDLAEGVTLYNSLGSPSIKLDPNGDAFFGSNLDYPAKTAMAVFSTAQKYNGENMGEGDLMLGDNSSGKANLLWDQSAGQLNLRTGTTSGIILDTDGLLKSGNYSADAAGWQISPDGNAEFNNIKARGSIQTAVFEYKSISAYSGALAVAKSAGVLAADTTTAATFPISVKESGSGQILIALNDILRIKYWNGTEVVDVWATCGTVGSAAGVSTTTATLNSGGTGKTLQEGATVVNYGVSGQGMVFLEAGDPGDATAPVGRLRISTHAGAPWTTQTNQVVLGDMYNQYGASTNHRYGIGIGDYSGGNYLSYNAETADTFMISSGGGKVRMDGGGIEIEVGGTVSDPTSYKFYESSVDDVTGGLGAYSDTTDYVELWAGITDNVRNSKVYIAGRAGSSRNANVYLVATGRSTTSSLDLICDSGSTPSRAAFTTSLLTTSGEFKSTGGINTAGRIRAEGSATLGTWSGDGAELLINASGEVLFFGYDRTGAHYLNMEMRATEYRIANENGTTQVEIDDMDIFTNAWTNWSSSCSVTGFSSTSTKTFYYKRLGKTVHCTFRIIGTSNSTAKTVSLPYTSAAGPYHFYMFHAQNAGTWGNGSPGQINPSTSTLTCYWYIPTGSWTASGTCEIRGSFTYEAA